MSHAPSVQLRSGHKRVNVWALVTGPADIPDISLRRISLDLREEDFAFLERMAAYRNALAAAAGRRITPWSRKSLCETFVAAQADATRQQLAEMFAACGEMPAADDKEGMAAYVKRVIAWDKKQK